jgi:hypothetical protein
VLLTDFSRVHVSQDRHQIFITFAEYDSSYVKYLNNKLPPNSARPFLRMYEFGPWNTMVRSDMEGLGGILLAIPCARILMPIWANHPPESSIPR